MSKRQSIERQVDIFLSAYHGMRRLYVEKSNIVLKGVFPFSAEKKGCPLVEDSFRLKILIPTEFPSKLPIVFETGGEIPRIPDYHVNQTDGSLCLGSTLTLAKYIASNPTLTNFAKKCIVPYLYAVCLFKNHGISWTFNELGHGIEGLISDYSLMFGVQEPIRILEFITYLGEKKRIANKMPCPCGCNKRFGKCKKGMNANTYRVFGTRKFFKTVAKDFERQLR